MQLDELVAATRRITEELIPGTTVNGKVYRGRATHRKVYFVEVKRRRAVMSHGNSYRLRPERRFRFAIDPGALDASAVRVHEELRTIIGKHVAEFLA